jgi:hypothetical protein
MKVLTGWSKRAEGLGSDGEVIVTIGVMQCKGTVGGQGHAS